MTVITIDKNVPMPNHTASGRAQKYPWEKMEVGDSFAHEGKWGSSAYNSARDASRKLAPKLFVSKKLSDGTFRIWRVA